MNTFDELNIVPKPGTTSENEVVSNFKHKSLPYKKYFGEMGISDEQKEERIAFSKKFEDKMLFFFALFKTMDKYGSVDIGYLVNNISSEYKKLAEEYGVKSLWVETSINKFASDLVATTYKHRNEQYALSDDRARYVSENEANTLLNLKDYDKAMKDGKTTKTWNTVIDGRERDTHREANRNKVPINEPFMVGDSVLMFPKDTSLGADPEEIVNCRCWVTYE